MSIIGDAIFGVLYADQIEAARRGKIKSSSVAETVQRSFDKKSWDKKKKKRKNAKKARKRNR